MERQRLLEKWNIMRAAIPAGAPAIQVKQIKRAFYAGASSFYIILMNDLPPETADGSVTQADLEVMAALHGELEAFRKQAEAEDRA